MQLLIDNFDRNHFTETGFKQFEEELERFMSNWGMVKDKKYMIDAFNNVSKTLFLNEEYVISKKNKTILEFDMAEIIGESKTPWEDKTFNSSSYDDDEYYNDEDEVEC